MSPSLAVHLDVLDGPALLGSVYGDRKSVLDLRTAPANVISDAKTPCADSDTFLWMKGGARIEWRIQLMLMQQWSWAIARRLGTDTTTCDFSKEISLGIKKFQISAKKFLC